MGLCINSRMKKLNVDARSQRARFGMFLIVAFFKSKYLSTLAINFCRLFLSQNAFGVVWLSLTGN